MKILLLCSSFNGLTQRVWIALRRAGHDVSWQTADDDTVVRARVAATEPDLILCPFLRERVPEDVWRSRPTVIIHPGPVGDRGPSSLDWAISDAEADWGVTALSAVAEMDAGPVWATREFPLPADPPRKSALYAGPVTDAAVELALEVATRVATPGVATSSAEHRIHGRLRPTMAQSDRAFSWTDPTEHVLRRIRAADGSPGVRTELAGLAVSVFDAHRGPTTSGRATPGEPGTIALRRHGAVLVRTGDGAVWIGHARPLPSAGRPRVKLPATAVLGERIAGVPESLDPITVDDGGYREVHYRRVGDVGVLTFDFYNGAASTGQCHRLAAALRAAAAQDTRVLVLQGGAVFGNGIHLNVIEAARAPAAEAWRNINAIDDACREIITCTRQLVVAAVGGNAGAGGVMLALGADEVLLRPGVVLNPHYATMGLFGSEYWTYVLPRRVGTRQAARLTEDCLPIGAAEAVEMGLADAVLPGDRGAFDAAVLDHARALAAQTDMPRRLAAKAAVREADEWRCPLQVYRARELAEMRRDLVDDRRGFAAARHAFVTKRRPVTHPATARRAV